MDNFWDAKYDTEDFLYGIEPNVYLKDFIDQNTPGKILFPGEGEGRNSVYAASKNYTVFAFDSSHVAQRKALKLAKQNEVTITYDLIDYNEFNVKDSFDYIALSYTHFPPMLKQKFLSKLSSILNPGGKIVFEAFSTKQIENNSGGPKNIDMLFTVNELENIFYDLNITYLREEEIIVNEGNGHKGKADVIRMIAEK